MEHVDEIIIKSDGIGCDPIAHFKEGWLENPNVPPLFKNVGHRFIETTKLGDEYIAYQRDGVEIFRTPYELGLNYLSIFMSGLFKVK